MSIRSLPTESVQFLFVIFVKLISDSSVSKFASGFDCTNRAPAFARSFEVPLCSAVLSHFTSDGLPASKIFNVPDNWKCGSMGVLTLFQ